jgi:hypothetical protein
LFHSKSKDFTKVLFNDRMRKQKRD